MVNKLWNMKCLTEKIYYFSTVSGSIPDSQWLLRTQLVRDFIFKRLSLALISPSLKKIRQGQKRNQVGTCEGKSRIRRPTWDLGLYYKSLKWVLGLD